MKKRLVLILAALSNMLIFAKPYNSTQSHEGAVNDIFSLETSTALDKTYYSAGNDGFIVKWNSDGMGEHYQISDQQIKLIRCNPVTKDIAVYDTDGVSIHRLTVVDSRTFAKKYTKRFVDSIASINFSAKGNYLIIGTTAVNGTYILNARTGAILKRTTDVTGVTSMAKTGDSEKTAILYSANGSIVYYDLINKKSLKKFNTERGLEQVTVFGSGKMKNRFLAGTRDNKIFLIDATSGKLIGQYSANSPLIFAAEYDTEESQGLYFTTANGRTWTLKVINEILLKKQVTETSTSNIFNPPEPLIVKNFTGLRSLDSFTCATKNSGSIMFGTSSGNIYTMTDIPESENYSLFPITEAMYQKILDINSENDSNSFLILTRDSIFKTSFDSKEMLRIGNNSGYTNFIKYKDSVILWSKNTRKTVQIQNLSDNSETRTIITPSADIKSLRIFDGKLIYVLGNSYVGMYNLEDNLEQELYTGTSIQDAVLIDENTLYVAKTATQTNDSALISVNIQTKETVPLKFPGNVAFNLSYDYGKNSQVYGITIKSTQQTGTVTEVFAFNPSTKVVSTLLRLSDEDNSAWTSIFGQNVWTNLGKNQVYACNSVTKKNMRYNRSASMPVKAEISSNKIAILNHNGSISWYNQASAYPIADWYLTINGEWKEIN